MKSNPGGEIAPEHVIGRDGFIENLWQVLEHQSVVLVSERRMGKSSVMKKMRAECTGRHVVFYSDVEDIPTPLEFVEHVFGTVRSHLGTMKRATSQTEKILGKLAGGEIAGLKFPPAAAPQWRELLQSAIGDLMMHCEHSVVFFWDELPLMLQKIKHNTDENTAMNLLDALRSLRQTHPKLRMVFTGSIGLHHVITSLREAGHTNDSTNDMFTVELDPLRDQDAQLLAAQLINGEELVCGDPMGTARAVANAVDRIPFYIHHVIALIKSRGHVIDSGLAEETVSQAMINAQDPWHLCHYRERMEEYYGQERVPVVLSLLDELAASNEPMHLQLLVSRLGASLKPERSALERDILSGNTEPVRRTLDALQRDHYIARRQDDGAYEFRFPLIKRWWRIHRSLPC